MNNLILIFVCLVCVFNTPKVVAQTTVGLTFNLTQPLAQDYFADGEILFDRTIFREYSLNNGKAISFYTEHLLFQTLFLNNAITYYTGNAVVRNSQTPFNSSRTIYQAQSLRVEPNLRFKSNVKKGFQVYSFVGPSVGILSNLTAIYDLSSDGFYARYAAKRYLSLAWKGGIGLSYQPSKKIPLFFSFTTEILALTLNFKSAELREWSNSVNIVPSQTIEMDRDLPFSGIQFGLGLSTNL